MRPTKEKLSLNTKSFLKDLVVTLGLSLNLAATYLALFIWKLNFLYCAVINLVFALIFSIYIKNLTKSIVSSVISIITGGIIGLGIVLMPSLLHGNSYEIIDLTIKVYVIFISKLAVFNLVLCVFSSIFGFLLAGDK